jgi:outer membrane lipoprotein SlyB
MNKETLIIAAIILVGLTGCEDHDLAESYSFTETITAVSVNVDLGDVILSAGDQTVVNVGISCRTVVPDYLVHVDGATLRIELEAGNGASACDAVFEIVVGPEVSADLRTGAGDVDVALIEGDLEIVTYDGDIRIDAVSGTLDLTAIAGDINGSRLENAPNRVTTGSGDVHLSYRDTPIE